MGKRKGGRWVMRGKAGKRKLGKGREKVGTREGEEKGREVDDEREGGEEKVREVGDERVGEKEKRW